MVETTKEVEVDMPDVGDMKNDAIAQAKYAAEHIKVENKISEHLKKFFDAKYGPNWHCLVGKSFNFYVSHESKHYIFFYVGPLAILLYKMG
mmetsp:Transcript_80576/g.94004  ORF Transcript_80576/g.94004 Transcript_80576/m.94004 type:complete len:91 (-) Transcript_80576:87-359(-)